MRFIKMMMAIALTCLVTGGGGAGRHHRNRRTGDCTARRAGCRYTGG